MSDLSILTSNLANDINSHRERDYNLVCLVFHSPTRHCSVSDRGVTFKRLGSVHVDALSRKVERAVYDAQCCMFSFLYIPPH